MQQATTLPLPPKGGPKTSNLVTLFTNLHTYAAACGNPLPLHAARAAVFNWWANTHATTATTMCGKPVTFTLRGLVKFYNVNAAEQLTYDPQVAYLDGEPYEG